MRGEARVWALMAICVAAGAAAGVSWVSQTASSREAVDQWPEDAPVALDISRPTLVLFVHPRSPETPAVLDELRRLQARMDGRLAVSVRVYHGEGSRSGQREKICWREAARSFSDVEIDPKGTQAALFGARPAGTAVMYAPSGRLLFRGDLVSRASNPRARPNRALAALLDAWRKLDRSPVIGGT